MCFRHADASGAGAHTKKLHASLIIGVQHPPLAAVWVCIIVEGHTGSPHEHKGAVGFSIGARPAVGKTGPG